MSDKKINILIVGAGRDGQALAEMFHKSEMINILGVVDINAEAPGIALAKKLGIPTGSDYNEFLKKKELDAIINVTGSEKIQKGLREGAPRGIEVISGHTANLMCSLVAEQEKIKNKTGREIKAAASQLDQIFQSVGDAMFAIDNSLEMVRVNDAFLNVLGARKEDLEKKGFREIIGEELYGINRDILEQVFKGKRRIERDITIERKDGIKIPCILTVTPLRDAEGKVIGVIETLKDITERRSAERALLENIRVKSNFTSMVSHELRTPLTAIKEGIAIVLDGSAGDINDEQKDFLDTAKRNVDRLARLINDVLDFTKLRDRKASLRIFENDISEPIREVAKSHTPVAKEKGLYLKTEIAPDLPRANFDMDKIIQVVTNLVNNAIKFTKEGGITITANRAGEEIYVSVNDTGPGIKKEDIPKVFQEFRQLDETATKETGGSGLGLSITREIVEMHGGKIGLESKYGEGSQFKFTIPIIRRYRVLIVDDDEGFLELCGKLLEKEGYATISAKTGMEGIKKAREERPDLLILDMRLPDINGYEIIGRLRSEKDFLNIPVIAISGYAGELEKIDRFEALGEKSAIPRLMKPIDNEDLLLTVRSILEHK